MVRYSPTHSQNAGLSWLNTGQCAKVAMPSSVANSTTAAKPVRTACHRRSRNATRAKKYTPPRYAEASVIDVMVDVIGQANSWAVSPGKTYKTTNASTKNGTMTAESTRT